MNKNICLILCMFIMSIFYINISSTFAEPLDEFTIMTENYPPYSFQKDGKLQGINVDVMVLVLEKIGSKQSRADIKLVPWARGYRTLQSEKNTCLFGMARSNEREKMFKWVGPIVQTKTVLTAKKDRKISISSIGDIKKYSVGVIIDDIGEQLLLQAGIEDNLAKFSGIAELPRMVKLLHDNRIDLWSYEETTTQWAIKEEGYNPEDYETLYVLREGEVYFAFHKDTPDSLIKKMQSVLDTILKSSQYQEIIDKYLR